MAYCSNCGAYLPDGKTVCVACGADSSVPKNEPGCSGSGAASAQATPGPKATGAPTSDELRRQMEEKQRRQKEQNAEWARQAYAGYKKGNAHRTSTAGGTKEAHRASSAAGSAGTQDSARTARPKDPEKSRKTLGKVLALLSYVSFFCILPFILTPEDSFAKFHAKQGILLLLLSVALDLLSAISFPLVGILSLARIFLMIKGIVNVLNDRTEPLPLIGKYAEQYLKF